MDDGWVATVGIDALARRGKTRVEVDGDAVALFLVGEQVYAIADVCPHEGRSLARGTVLDGCVVCVGHQWTFDLETGECRGRPVRQPVFATRVVEGRVLVRRPPGTGPAP